MTASLEGRAVTAFSTSPSIPASTAHQASLLKRRRATSAEMEERTAFFIDYACEHGPVTVRGLYYHAEVHRAPRPPEISAVRSQSGVSELEGRETAEEPERASVTRRRRAA
jgi:hypothetical protein